MSYDIRLVKLISGDMVVAKFNEDAKILEDPATIQAMPTQQGTQMVLLPFGYPFDQEMHGEISMEHILFEYKTCPEELKTKYIEAVTNISMSSGGLDLSGGAGPDGLGGGGGGLNLV
ncbi:hypothetical protein [Pseudodesulfovibrio piezophilus]|uniref:Uncharacterized protein n=1 Tax=Pseudodesulfovibrio piezophilus (strain DSM 21447 / JCM 15486 / C1TLV30) TaxID=1322246 RepID=M1WMZ1_PSEP2|nr:hypothetical protein [Pseudodesulfovibrio piezophilus]CCH47279.1 conserved protein of unknown function [Pseudodesulfovibrio piezophilus C1TLV30]